MERKNQIFEAGQEYSNSMNEFQRYHTYPKEAFIEGAKWADTNPQFSKEEFIEKACEWLNKYASDYAFSIYDEDDACSVSMDLVDDFKEAMEQLWNEKK